MTEAAVAGLLFAGALLVLAAVMVVRTRRRARALEAERDLLVVLRDHVTDAAEAHTVKEAMGRSLRFVGRAFATERVDLVYFQPPNKVIHAGALRDGDVVQTAERVPESTRALIQDWIKSDPTARALGAGDAHPLRPWLREQGIASALVVPLVRPEPHGVLVIASGTGEPGVAHLPLATALAGQVLESLLRARREELLERVRADGAADRPGQIDPDTGLPGEGALQRFLAEATEGGATTALCSMRVRATPGVTKEVGHRLLTAVRGTDLVAKVDEDRFVVVMTQLADPSIALRTAERLVGQIRRPVVEDGLIVRPTCSAGVALWSQGMRVGEILEVAHAAEVQAAKDPLHAVHLHVEDPAPQRVVG